VNLFIHVSTDEVYGANSTEVIEDCSVALPTARYYQICVSVAFCSVLFVTLCAGIVHRHLFHAAGKLCENRLKDDMQRFFTKLMQKSFLAAYCNINPSV